MTIKLADQVRSVAIQKYVQPAKRAGSAEFSIAVKDLLRDLEPTNFPPNYTPLVCNSIKTKGFQRENNLEITRVEGPKSQTGTRVVVHYRVLGRGHQGPDERGLPDESAQDRAKRLVQRLRGLLRNEIKVQGGSQAFVRWVRSDDEDAS